MPLIYGLYFSYQYQIGSYQYGDDGFKNLGSKTIGSSIQSFFEISDDNVGLCDREGGYNWTPQQPPAHCTTSGAHVIWNTQSSSTALSS